MNTEASKNCPKCLAPIPSEAPQGLCPKCLLASASTQTEAGQSKEAAALPSMETIAAGFPNLEILEFIGQGGMGIVFKARQPKLDRFVALKLLPQKPGADPAFCERFNREARVLARLSHPNIVAVHDFGEAGPFFYLLMEYVDGVNLRQAMQAGRFTPAQSLALVPKICDALQYAHEEGVLHRDIKPENLLLDTRGRVKIADFGIAKLVGDAKDITLTARGAAMGTPHYMAPEQLERPQDVDQRADVYSLGVVFYEMLTGELPIGRFAPPSEKAPMDPRVDQVVLRTLEKERERRYQSAGDVRTQVEKITANPVASHSGLAGPSNFEPDSQPQPPLIQTNVGPTLPRKHTSWSWRAVVAPCMVGISFLVLAVAVLGQAHIGPEEMAAVSIFIGFPALAGTLLGWTSLRNIAATSGERRGGRLALISAVTWPILLLDLVFLLVLLLCAQCIQWYLFRVRAGGLIGMVAVVGALALLALDGFIVRRFLNRWNSERALPHAELRDLLKRVPRRVFWLAGFGSVVLALLLLANHRQMSGIYEPVQVLPIADVNAPPGFEVVPGGAPGNDERVYRSAFSVPAGYALTLSAVLCSNQMVLKDALPNGVAVLMAPEGAPVQGQLTWRLLGNTTFADGAPLQFSFDFPQGPEHFQKTFHLVPPEPITIDWVGEPAQVWPPQNGHTRFLLLKGSSGNSGAEIHLPKEWGIGLEARLDPIPANILQNLKSPLVNLRTNGTSGQDAAIEN